jgi:sugar phosphate isomerase/epimerase
MAKTSTGSFPIGFRRGWSEWQKSLDNTIAFAKANDFEAIDTGPEPVDQIKKIVDAGLKVGTIDLKNWGGLCSADAGKRKAAAQENIEYVKAVAPLGAHNFFVVIIPEDGAKARKDNFSYAVDGYGQLLEGVKSVGARIAIEGWPGGAPHYSSLACTPADYRALLKALPANAGINFDASHLVRMGIDYIRFLNEFATKVVHVHGKDTELLDDELYEHGNTQPATFAKHHGFGEHCWRYTIPGHGQVRFKKVFSILKDAGFKGCVCVELEDENYNTDEKGEKAGLIYSRQFLQSF